MTMVLTGVALATLAGIMSWAVTSAKQTDRANQYARATASAEAVVEKVLSQLCQDYLSGGEALVQVNLSQYQQTVLTSADSPYWGDWQFSDAQGNPGQTYIQGSPSTNYVVLNSTYAGLQGFASMYTIVSDACETAALQNVTAGVYQQIELARIPIFQFAMFSSDDMEISCGQPFVITGRVHSDGNLYVEPDNALTFQSDVTAVGDILFQREPLDTRGTPAGSVVYQGQQISHVPVLTLPIGVSNTPTAIQQIIEPPPPLESPTSSMGRLRYYNLVDMVLTVSDSRIIGTSGLFNGFSTVVPAAQLQNFVNTSNSFYDAREAKTVRPIDINITNFVAWSATNTSLRLALHSRDVSSLYVYDLRTPSPTTLGAVRLINGQRLPSLGLTVATALPIYVQGHFNQPNAANVGTSNTSTTLPASLVGDAVTILSTQWSDANSTAPLSSRVAGCTTVNAAILAGEVETTAGHYSGGMENFPRFLESWGLANVFTYNGSMVKMFPSAYATNFWGLTNVYNPPARNWAFDVNFNTPSKLPPLTPSLQKVLRCQWATVAPNQTVAPANN